ncbi:MAG TPA: hypothetical protein VD902_10950 [Symbiobacteriaceae bacterium]|nr:hypothetical protein [Symbiobacteriaceae bacterium]
MSSLAKVPAAEAPRSPRAAQILTAIVVVLAGVAAAGGVFLPDLYRGNAWILSATRGQDVYTLVVAVPAMAVTLFFLKPGAVRAALVMLGITGYMLYTYTGAALTFPMNEFFPIYVALFSLSVFGMAALTSSIDVARIDRRFDATTPRKPVAIFVIFMGVMLALMEIGQVMPFYTTGALPLPMQLAESTSFYPLALDMGLIAPLCVLSGVWLWRRQPWGYLLTSCMLIKSATMGLALLATNWYAWLMGTTPDSIEFLALWAIIGFGGLGMTVWFLRHCRG